MLAIRTTIMTVTNDLVFRQQPTLVGCINGRGVVGDFYDDDEDEDDNNGNGNDDEDNFDEDL